MDLGLVSSKVIWGSNIAKDPPTVTYEEAMTDRGLFNWLSKVVSVAANLPSHRNAIRGFYTFYQDKFGMCFVTGIPPTPEDTEKLSERIGFTRETKCSCRCIKNP